MAIPNWQEFLDQHASNTGDRNFVPNPPATNEQIAVQEIKLKVNLPPSYRAFLEVSNGLRNLAEDRPGLREVEKLTWFKKEHREWVDAYVSAASGIESPLHDADYFDYGTVDCVKFDAKHLAQCLCLSDTVDEAVLLLNPMVVWPDGEWETWYFSNSLPGAIRFRSFTDWMHSQLAGIVEEPSIGARFEGDTPTIFRDGPSKPDRRVMKPIKIPPLGTVLKGLGSPKETVRAKSVRDLARIGGSEAVTALINTMQQDSSGEIRCDAAKALGHIKASDAIDALIKAINDPAINSTAVYVLGQIRDERAVAFLLKLIETKGQYWAVGAYCLAQRDEQRSIPLLISILLSERPEDEDGAESAVSILMAHGTEPAYDALAQHARHPNAKIRERVIRSLDCFAFRSKQKGITMQARALLTECAKTETDPNVRRWLDDYISPVPQRE